VPLFWDILIRHWKRSYNVMLPTLVLEPRWFKMANGNGGIFLTFIKHCGTQLYLNWFSQYTYGRKVIVKAINNHWKVYMYTGNLLSLYQKDYRECCYTSRSMIWRSVSSRVSIYMRVSWYVVSSTGYTAGPSLEVLAVQKQIDRRYQNGGFHPYSSA
jgi:hypothetical protein